MPRIRFNKFYRYNELTRLLKDYSKEYPNLIRLESIGKSHEGRDIWLITATNFKSGNDMEKPAFWVDGNIHASEVTASAAALYLIQSLVTNTNANVSGPIVTVDGQTYATPHTFAWPPSSAHTIAARTQIVGTTRYDFLSWSDGGAISHVVSPTANTTYTMNFTTAKKRRAQLTSQ